MMVAEPRTIDDWFAVIQRDFVDTAAGTAGLELIRFDPRSDANRVPDQEEWRDPGAPERCRVLLRVGDNITSVDDAEADPGAAAVHIASYLQDYVMDQLNGPWPQRTVDGRVVVLQPELVPPGEPAWTGGGALIPLGGLAPGSRR